MEGMKYGIPLRFLSSTISNCGEEKKKEIRRQNTTFLKLLLSVWLVTNKFEFCVILSNYDETNWKKKKKQRKYFEERSLLIIGKTSLNHPSTFRSVTTSISSSNRIKMLIKKKKKRRINNIFSIGVPFFQLLLQHAHEFHQKWQSHLSIQYPQ